MRSVWRRKPSFRTGAAMLVAWLAAAFFLSLPARAAPRQAILLDVDGAIGPAMAGYVTSQLRAVDPNETGLVILRMNTPGGLDSSMRAIITAILASPTPVAAYVAPSGARAASAGTYIAYACSIAAMAPGTNIGAATPVQMGIGPEPSKQAGRHHQDAETRKIINDAVAYIRGLAEINGRNADWAEQAVRTAASVTASQALKLNVIDVVANDVPDLLRKIDGRTVLVAGRTQRLATAGLTVVAHPPDWRTDLLAVITNPNVTFLLGILGIAGLAFEFATPGALLPGVVGAISMIGALLALDFLPIDYAGAALALLGIGLMIAEIHIGSFGLLGVAGVIAFAFGGLIMLPSAPGLSLSRPLVVAVTIAAAGFFLMIVSLLQRSRRLPVVVGREALLGAEGEAISWDEHEGRVRVQGEIWRACAARPLAPGIRIRVIGRRGLVLTVEPS